MEGIKKSDYPHTTTNKLFNITSLQGNIILASLCIVAPYFRSNLFVFQIASATGSPLT